MKLIIKKVGLLLFFILLFPYALTLLTKGIHRMEERNLTSIESAYTVCIATNIGTSYLTLEEYLLGVMVGCTDPTYELELLKAQAVILRTNLIVRAEIEDGFSLKKEGTIYIRDTDEVYYDVIARKEIWGEMHDEYGEKFYIALNDTKNMVATKNGELINLPFFSVSAGTTRNASDFYENKLYEGMGGVSCEYDILAPDYLQTYYFTTAEIRQAFGRSTLNEELDIEIVERDEADYVIKLKLASSILLGEEFREGLQLPSANFTVRQEEGGFTIYTKGIGHGVGLSLYAGNEMAAGGDIVFYDILTYFYKDINIKLYV